MWDSRNRDDTVGGKREPLAMSESCFFLFLSSAHTCHCTPLLHHTGLHCKSLLFTALHLISLLFTALHFISLLFTALHSELDFNIAPLWFALHCFLDFERGLHPSSVVRKASGCSAPTNYLFIRLSIHDKRRAAKWNLDIFWEAVHKVIKDLNVLGRRFSRRKTLSMRSGNKFYLLMIKLSGIFWVLSG